MHALRKNATKTRGRPFKPGNSGRPKGARNRRLPHPLETAGRLSSHCTELFDAALEDGQGDRSRAARRRETEPAGNRAARDPAWRAQAEAPAGDLTPPVLRALSAYRFYNMIAQGQSLPLRYWLSAESDAIR